MTAHQEQFSQPLPPRLAAPLKSLAALLPLWLVSLAITVEGFPRPPVTPAVALAALVLAIAISAILVCKRWMAAGLALVSLVPLALLPIFDEISTAYKTPFIVVCALLLTAGAIGYLLTRRVWWRWLILLSAVVLTVLMASHAASSFWHMAGALGYEQCFPDAHGCPPSTSQTTPWWVLFLGV